MQQDDPNPNLAALRTAESELILAHLRPGMRVLEIGGGNGLQAKLVEEFGCDVTSIDIPARVRPPVQYFDVLDYDGARIPAGSSVFDAIFSSNVLEHVRDLPALFAEMRRVLKPGAFAVHLVPSATWRFWTSAARYPFFVKRIFARGEAAGPADPRGRLRRTASFVKSLIVEPPHGEHPNALVELYHFRRKMWTRVFQDNGFELIDSHGSHLFYTGYSTFPALPIEPRRKLARVLGSSCHVFVVRPRER